MTKDQQCLSDLGLIDDIRRGVNASVAYRTLVNRYKDYAFTLAYRVLNNREEAEEAAQDAFVKAFKGLDGFNGSSKFTTWLYRIVLNAALTVKTRRRAATSDIEDARGLSVSVGGDELKVKEQRFYIQKGLALLSADDVRMISLFYLEEMSLEEVAEASGIEINTVKVKLHRARKRLSEVLQELMDGEAKSLY
jgi:RNA polymerase sigma factor (sigma-70 family)